jgi:bla regulator protein BlaR1
MTPLLMNHGWPWWIQALANHLWQSTVFALTMGLVAVAFRRYQARVRYALWFAASLKFFVPLSLLIGLGTQFAHFSPTKRAPSPFLSTVVRQISVPFDDVMVLAPSSSAPKPSAVVGPLTSVLGIWICGALTIACSRWRAWRRLNALVDVATASNGPELGFPPHVDVRSVSGMTEPGVFGFIRPIILLPRGIDAYLNRAQLEAVLAHELCHIKRYDNLTAAIHMLVEAVFWFHPLVWWIGARLIDERERACDEHVLATCGMPDSYAEGILNVCKHYRDAPMPCTAGVSGSNLKERIQTIIANRIGRRLSVAARLVLVLLGMGAVAKPLMVGAQSPPARPEFEVASIKPNKSGGRQVNLNVEPGGRFTATNVSLEMLIRFAYGESGPLPPNRLSVGQRWAGGGDYVQSDHFDVIAKADAGASQKDVALMLRALLADRFKLMVHHETRERPIYALVVVRKDGLVGPRLRRSDVDCSATSSDKTSTAIRAPRVCRRAMQWTEELPRQSDGSSGDDTNAGTRDEWLGRRPSSCRRPNRTYGCL